MSAAAGSDDPAAAYAAICAGRREGDAALQSTWALPHHSAPGDPANADGVRAAESRLPQTEGLTNAEAAQDHLDAHMADVQAAAETQTRDSPGHLELRDASKREIGVRLLPWNTIAETRAGLEYFKPGAFSGVEPSHVKLMLSHQGTPAGKGIALEERSDGAYMVFRVSKTLAGDELLTLASDGVVDGVSVAYNEVPGGTTFERAGGRPVRVISKADLRFVATVWNPTWDLAQVQFVRSQPEGEIVPETDATPAATTSGETTLDQLRSVAAIEERRAELRTLAATDERLAERLEKLEIRARQDIVIPPPKELTAGKQRTGEWVQMALRLMTGERVSDIQMRALSDLITSDNVGVVPDSVIAGQLIGIIDPARPFLETTRQLPTPDTGLTLTVPVIVTRPTVGVQDPEKEDIVSSTTSITTTGFDATTIAGGGDISLQLLKRSSPSYLDLYLRLLAEAYAIDGDVRAVAKLLDSGVTPGSAYIDPENLTIGEAWTNAVSVSRLLAPNRMWMSTAAIQAFIDAKNDGTNAPLYATLAADITVANGAQGFISGLRPVYVPALDGSGADVLIGPDRGFAWAEDGTFTLQVDVPSKAGRDVALVGILWFAPLYPAAFTSYRLAT